MCHSCECGRECSTGCERWLPGHAQDSEAMLAWGTGLLPHWLRLPGLPVAGGGSSFSVACRVMRSLVLRSLGAYHCRPRDRCA